MTEEINDGQIDGEECTPQNSELPPNTNCLEGIRCPKCGSYEPFRITVTCTALAYDEGASNPEDIDWDDESDIRCVECGHTGVVADFTHKEGGTT